MDLVNHNPIDATLASLSVVKYGPLKFLLSFI